jgi:hypothetical protein
MFIFFFSLAPRLKKKKKTSEPAPMLFRSPNSGRAWFAILLVGVSQAPQESAGETAYLCVRQQLAVVLHLVCSTFFTRWVGPRHAAFVSLSPSNPVRPQIFSRLNYKKSLHFLSTCPLHPQSSSFSSLHKI